MRFINSLGSHVGHSDRPVWPKWSDLIEPIMATAVQPYGYSQGEHPRIMLAKLAAGQRIERHIDGAPAARFPHKIHVPVQTNEGAFLHLGNSAFHLQEGQAYEVNNNIPHYAENNGTEDRIHLIFEYYPM